MRRAARYAGFGAYLIPNGVDRLDVKPPISAWCLQGGKEQGRGLPALEISAVLHLQILADGFQTVIAHLVLMLVPAFLRHEDGSLLEIYVGKVDVSHSRPAHSAFEQDIDDRSVSVRAETLTLRSSLSLEAISIFRTSSGDRQGICCIQDAIALLGRDGSLYI